MATGATEIFDSKEGKTEIPAGRSGTPDASKLSSISFFCPAFLDEDNLPYVVKRGVATLRRIAGDFEWLIIDDASPDGTGRVADSLAAMNPEVSVLHKKKNEGHGPALKTGFAAARFEWAGFCDGDDQYDARDIALLAAHTADADVIIGRRSAYPNGGFRGTLSWLFNAALRHLFGVPFHDLGCSMKLFRSAILPVVSAKSDSIFTQCEMVLRAHRAGLRIVEVEVPAYPRIGGRSTSVNARSVALVARDALSLWKEFHL